PRTKTPKQTRRRGWFRGSEWDRLGYPYLRRKTPLSRGTMMIRKSRAEGAQVTTLRRVRLIGVGVGLGAVVSHLFDPDRGHARRARARDQIAAAGRRVRRRAERATLGRVRHARDHAGGVVRGGLHMILRERPDDATLAQKVRSEVLGPRPVRGVSVDASNGVVHLRGELAAQALIDELTAE